MKVSDLVAYFTTGIQVVPGYRNVVGMEIETMFVDDECGFPISLQQSQGILRGLVQDGSWSIAEEKADMVTKIRAATGETICYELGWHNLEVAVPPTDGALLVVRARRTLAELYRVAGEFVARPIFEPVFPWSENLLAIPDERDSIWLRLDGREALNILARTAAVQFMFTVTVEEAVAVLNNLNRCLPHFLKDYPQAKSWERYVRTSRAGYRPDRFAGPRQFESLEDYCEQLALHDVVTAEGLVPFQETEGVDLSLYLRSVWWHFRLRRFGDNLCIEFRPIPRRGDDEFRDQLWKAANAMEGQVVGPAPTPREVFFAKYGRGLGDPSGF